MAKIFLFIIMLLIVSSMCFAQGTSTPLYVPGKYEISLGDRTYGAFLPQKFNGINRLPVVIYLHGSGGDAESAYRDGIDQYAEKHGFILISPQALRMTWWRSSSTRWNGGEWDGGSCCGTADDVGFISMLIEDIKDKFRIDNSRVYATGISNGGLMVNRLACELSDKIAAIATVAPTAIPNPCVPSFALSVMNIHGTSDPCNPYDGSNPTGICGTVDYTRMSPIQVVAKWRDILNCFGVPKTIYQKGKATCSSFECKDKKVVFCKVEDMGHTWPSGSQYLPESIIGAVSYDLSMDQIWEFFHGLSIRKK